MGSFFHSDPTGEETLLLEKWQYSHSQFLRSTRYTGQGSDGNAYVWDWTGWGTVASFVDHQGLLCAGIQRGD